MKNYDASDRFAESTCSRIAELRKEKRLTQTDLARLADVKQQNISEIEKGMRFPTLPMLYRIAVALGVEPSSLLGKANEPES